jgi:hypothetical protein
VANQDTPRPAPKKKAANWQPPSLSRDTLSLAIAAGPSIHIVPARPVSTRDDNADFDDAGLKALE